jgi:hypothetical protein
MVRLRSLFIFTLVTCCLFLTSGGVVSAHQPRMPSENKIAEEAPEVSKAYYAKLTGTPHVYTISSDTQFSLYVNILAPDIANQKTDFVVTIVKKGITDKKIAFLDGTKFKWTKFFEPFGHDNYLKGPEYKATSPAGVYEVTVTDKGNDSKYVLAVGELESFGFKESANAIKLIPKIKTLIFDKSPIDFTLSPIGIGYIVVVFIFSFVFSLIFKFIMKKHAPKKSQRLGKNIGIRDRMIRAGLGLLVFILAIATAWSPILIFLAGFLFFEAIFSWCGYFALLGKNSCLV